MLTVLSSWIVLKGGLVFLEIALLLYEHVIKPGIPNSASTTSTPTKLEEIIADRTCHPPGNATATYCMTPIELNRQVAANPTLAAQTLQQSRIQLKSDAWDVDSCRGKRDQKDYTCITFLKSGQLISSTQPSAQVLVSCIFPTLTNPRSQAQKGIVASGILNNYNPQENTVYLHDCQLEQTYTP